MKLEEKKFLPVRNRGITLKNRLNSHDLKREIGFFSATILVIANMVGTGIFTTSGFIIEKPGDPQTMLLCWLVGGIFALSGFSYISVLRSHCVPCSL